MAIEPIGSGSIWLTGSTTRDGRGEAGPLRRLFSGDAGTGENGAVTDLFALSDPLSDQNAGGAALGQLSAVAGNLAEGQARVAQIFAAGQAPQADDVNSLLAWLASLNSSGVDATGQTIIGFGPQDGASSAGTDILNAVLQPGIDLVGQIIDLLG